ncbi:protein of unknown function (plasmid) [Paraburkholderia dioscoreae]|uniref:Uncharacterized protein n=1 Tax=Paraburkholderia dioscoreae TaxID=2604047 RepID=A0A5Q4ZHM1_9BURK|nr:protein of unknown function [Paraburkholderia dioscoreae]
MPAALLLQRFDCLPSLLSFFAQRRTDALHFLLDCDAVQLFEWQIREELDALPHLNIGLQECLALVVVRAFGRRRVGHAPVCFRRVTGPNRAYLAGCVVANRKNEVDLRCAVFSEFVPALAAQPFGRNPLRTQQVKCIRVRSRPGMAAGAVADEPVTRELIKRRFSKDRARGIMRTEEKDVVFAVFGHEILQPVSGSGLLYRHL